MHYLKPLIPFLITYSLPFLLACIAEATISNLPTTNTSIPAFILFGDSNVDTSNNNYITTLAKADFSPYGEDFLGGKATGRFSNGKIPSDLFVEELGIKPLLPAYLDPTLQDEDLLTGVSFASGASGYDPLTSKIFSVLSLDDQIEKFKEYITRVKRIGGDKRASEIVREGIMALITGSNDITNTYFLTPFRNLEYDVHAYADLLVTHASRFVEDLYGLGARRIAISGLPPIGCMPSQRTLRGGVERECVGEYNEIAELFNNKLSNELTSLNQRFSDARVLYVDVYYPALDVIQHPQNYGFEVSNRGCCGTGLIEVTFMCKIACRNVSEYVFWDSFHPTEKVYRIIVRNSIQQYLDNNFI